MATHAVTLTGASWTVDYFGDYALAPDLALSPVSFDDRLHVFGVAGNGTVGALSYTIDGGSWYDEPGSPPELKTNQAIATVGFLDRLYVFARDQTTNHLSVTSSSDLRIWVPCATSTPSIPSCGSSPPCAARSASRASSRLAAKVENCRAGNARQRPRDHKGNGLAELSAPTAHALTRASGNTAAIDRPHPFDLIGNVVRLTPRVLARR